MIFTFGSTRRSSLIVPRPSSSGMTMSMITTSHRLANVLDSLIVTDLEGLVTYWNEGATQLFGWTGTEMVGRPLLGRFPEHMRPQIAALTGSILDGQEWAGEFEDYRKDGSRVWIDARVTRMTDAAGQVTGVIGVARDISRRKQAEAERDRLLAQLRVQIDRMPLGYLLLDADLRIVDWNPAAERLFGYRKDEMVGLILPVERLVPAAAVPQGEAVLRRLQSGDMAAHAINENLTKDGRTITCEWHNTPLFDANGAIVGFLALAQDISDRQRAEEELRASEQRFRQIAESIREVFWLTDPLKQEVVYVSPAYETIWGRTTCQRVCLPRTVVGGHSHRRPRLRPPGRRHETTPGRLRRTVPHRASRRDDSVDS